MSVSAFNKPTLAPLQVVNDKKTTDAGEHLHAISCKTTSGRTIKEVEPTLKVVDTEQTPNNFTITFSYAQQLHRTKVLKVGAGYRKPAFVYKVVLNSRLSTGESQLCWLQQTQKGWDVLLGEDLDIQLIKAITTAIEDME
jgi:hypothetical protein